MREVLAGAVLELHRAERVEEHLYAQPIGAVTVDAHPSVITPEAEKSIDSAAAMIANGLPALNVLRCLYIIAYMAGLARS